MVYFGIFVLRPTGRQSDAIPTGTRRQATTSPTAGNCMERNTPLTPPCSQPSICTPAPSVAGHPATDNQHRHPLNNKKSGPDSVKSEKTACTQGGYGLK